MQVDPYKQNLSPGDPIDEENRISFLKYKEKLLEKLTENQM